MMSNTTVEYRRLIAAIRASGSGIEEHETGAVFAIATREKMLKAVPSSPEQVCEQVAQFGYAERYLPVWSFFLRARAKRPTPRGPAWPA